MGNYWSDLNDSGEYTIPGAAGSIDRYAQPYGTGLDLFPIILAVGALGVVAVVVVVALKLRHRI